MATNLDELGENNLIDEAPLESEESEVNFSLPYSFARRHGVVVTQIDDHKAYVSHLSNIAITTLAELRRHLAIPVQLTEVNEETFEEQLAKIYEAGAQQATQIMANMGDDLDLDHVARELAEPEDLLQSDDDAPIIRLINALFTEAIKENASDIHIEPYESKLVVRFRVDGILREVLEPPRTIAPFLASRIKVMAHLDIAEKRLPQDGRISLKVGNRPVDIRVSTLPSSHGERVVLRLLDKQAGRLDLKHLGVDKKILDKIDPGIIFQPHGIFLVTGPTGSGKTTTLYAALTRLNDKSRNIVTIEDPIEYNIEGVGQTQVNTKVDLTFARGLRAILRQDPDIVMVGEIRDIETAQIAVQASLTGHLVLSTLHTNTAIGSITRLRDMGVEPFLLSSSLVGVLAQRLIRLLCPHCKQHYTANQREIEILGVSPSLTTTLFKAAGCEHCHHLGFIGRTGIHELIVVDEALRNMIHAGSSEQEMLHHVRKECASIRSDGLRRVLAGDTSLDEVIRVTQEG
ncbi:MAG: type II secretion system ATPase GspE [Candidatus Polarisedimenticolaceae bacterium]|nr:type II secretion system ATPase GspE [Candidatus Polarisedimenticolaceae bacterium]